MNLNVMIAYTVLTSYHFTPEFLVAYNCHHYVLYLTHYRKDYIFWSDTVSDRIVRSRLNGTDRVILLTGGMSCVCELIVRHARL